MGNDYSIYLNEIKPLPSNICVIHIVEGKFYGINLPPQIIQSMQIIYRQVWTKDIQVEMICPNVIKLKPHKTIMVNNDSARNSVMAKQMFCRFHKTFCQFGWSLVSSPTLTYEKSLSTWFYFKQINPFMVDSGTISNEFCVIGLSSTDKFQFIDFPTQLQNPVIECIRKTWTRGIQNISIVDGTENSLEIKLRGNPWSCRGEQSLDARFLVLCLIRFMSHHNWRLVNSTAMKPDASDTMFFRYFAKSFDMECPQSMPEYYFMLALKGNNSFSILGGDEMITNTIAKSCVQHESKGVKSVYLKHNYPTVELVSNIWQRCNEKEMETRKLMTSLFQDLGTIGWLPIESIDCTRHEDDLSSIAFVRVPPTRMLYFCLCPRKYEGICLINAIEEVKNIVMNVFTQNYVIKREMIKRSLYGVAHSIDFCGNPFRGDIHCALIFHGALAAIISALKEAGWYLIVSADTSKEIRVETHRDINTNQTKQETKKWSIYGLWFGKVLID